MKSDLEWFIGFMLFFAVLWFVGGGVGASWSQKPFITPIGPNGAGGETYGPNGESGGKININGGNQNSGTQGNLGGASGVQTSAEKLQTVSPLSGKLSINYISSDTNDYSANPNSDTTKEYLVLNASSANAGKILLTGLSLKSAMTGNTVIIGKGVSLPFMGIVNYEEPIYLEPGATAYIITGRSPNGMSFRLNKCSGFLQQFQTFSPYISEDCPRPNEYPEPAAPNNLSDKCLDYIDQMPSCRIAINPPQSLPSDCLNYLATKITYASCIDLSKNKTGFYKNEWRIYLNRTNSLWKQKRETVQLVDTNGKIIDAKTY